MRGPVALGPSGIVPADALCDLYQWAASNRYIFIRFTHADTALLDSLEACGPSRRLDACPFHLDRSVAMHDLVIEQAEDDNAMLSGFDREARRKIKRALEADYDLRVGTSSSDLAEVWHVFLNFFDRKGIRFNLPLDGFLEAARLAESHDCLRVYSAWLDQKPLEALIVFRDKHTALCQFAALDIEALGKRPSPSVLLHWFAMRDLHRMGALHYNLGPGTGSLLQFKQQFRPLQVTYPAPVTAVINKPLYLLWSSLVLPSVRVLKPCAAWIVKHLRGHEAATDMPSQPESTPTRSSGMHLVPGGRS
jgi:hypothetical protein